MSSKDNQIPQGGRDERHIEQAGRELKKPDQRTDQEIAAEAKKKSLKVNRGADKEPAPEPKPAPKAPWAPKTAGDAMDTDVPSSSGGVQQPQNANEASSGGSNRDTNRDTAMGGTSEPAQSAPPAPPAGPIGVATPNPFGIFDDELASFERKKRRLDDGPAPADKIEYKVEDHIPLGLEFSEPTMYYPEFLGIDNEKKFSLNSVHSGSDAYRGTDRPSFKTGSEGKKNTKIGNSLKSAMVYIRDGSQFGSTFGWPSSQYPGQKLKDPRTVKVKFQLDTQRPSTAIVIQHGDATVTYEVFANSLMRKADEIGLSFAAGNDPMVFGGLPLNTAGKKELHTVEDGKKVDGLKKKLTKQLKLGDIFEEHFIIGTADSKEYQEHHRRQLLHELAEKGRVWKTDLALNAADQQPTTGATGRPRWSGISPTQIAALKDKLERGEAMSRSEELIVELDRATSVSIYQEFWLESAPDLAPFFQYMRATSYACAHLGNLWWYSLAYGGGNINDTDYPFSGIPIPRWLVTKWRVMYVNSMPASAEPLHCESFRVIDTGIYPDESTFAFENRLATAREEHHALAALQNMATSEDFSIFARFRRGMEGKYIGLFNIAGKNGAVRSALPDVGTKIEVGATVSGKPLRMSGVVVHDPYPSSSADFAAFVGTTKPNAPEIAEESEYFRVAIKYPYDATATNRCLSAVENLQCGQVNHLGTYIPEFALGAPRPERQQPGWLSRHFVKTPGKKTAFDTEVARHGLNNSQMQAVNRITQYEVDVCNIMGPPGTGKTKAMVALIMGLLATGARVLVCAASNNAVDKLCQEIHGRRRLPGQYTELCWVRFTSALARTKPGNDDAAEASGAGVTTTSSAAYIGSWDDDFDKAEREHDALLFQQVMVEATSKRSTVEASFGFAHKKMRFVESYAGEYSVDEGGNCYPTMEVEGELPDYQAEALRFLSYCNQLRYYHELKLNAPKKLRAQFYELDEFWSRVYLEQGVKLVFCTPSTSCKEPLIDFFHPHVMTMDEAGQSSPPDTMTALAPYKEDLRAVVFAGDYKQLAPVVISKSTGEAHEILTRSLFKGLVKDPHARFPTVMLDTQYRMDPVLSKFPREVIYADVGALNDADSVKDLSDTQRNLTRLLKPLADSNVWNGRVRMAINCDGHSEVPADSTSPQNESEANQAVRIAAGLVASGIGAEKILIITPYLGQRRLIYNKLTGQGNEQVSKIRISSTHKVQGEEAEIVIVSLVQHEDDPNNIGFIHEEDQLTVEITRAKDFLFVLGNFGGWMSIIKTNKRGDFLMNRACDLFRKFIQDCYDHGDIINDRDWQLVMTQGQMLERSSFYSGVFANPPKLRDYQADKTKAGSSSKSAEFSQRKEAPVRDLEKLQLGDKKGGGKPNKTFGGRGKPPGSGKNSGGGPGGSTYRPPPGA